MSLFKGAILYVCCVFKCYGFSGITAKTPDHVKNIIVVRGHWMTYRDDKWCLKGSHPHAAVWGIYSPASAAKKVCLLNCHSVN